VNWTGPAELKAQLLRLWERGELLREPLGGATRFPLRLVLKVPSSADITDRLHAVRAWASALAADTHVRLEWRDVRHRVQGSQRLPDSAWIDTRDQALAWLGKRSEAERFGVLVDATRAQHAALLPWLAQRPLQALALADDWPHLLAVIGWVRDHPRPAIYLRQVDLPGVHTKFIEAHRAVLAELLDLGLPGEQVDAAHSGMGRFASRYGFKAKPVRIRFRVLDPALATCPGLACPDVTLDADSFSRLQLPLQRVFVTENEINFLAFPQVPGAIVIFGAGYGWESLAHAQWLHGCAMHYWGDIDTHGFAILNQLRAHFPQAASFLMDRDTLQAHTAVWGVEDQPTAVDLTRLTSDERALYDDLRDNRIRRALRLEQEWVGFRWMEARLPQLTEVGLATGG
jgi:hypothetical protein